MYVLYSLSELLLPEMCEEPAGHDSFPLPLLADLVVSEPLEGVSELLPVKRHVLWQGMRAIRVLRRGVNIVDQIWAVLVGCHVSLVLHVLVLGTVEVPSEVHSWL